MQRLYELWMLSAVLLCGTAIAVFVNSYVGLNGDGFPITVYCEQCGHECGLFREWGTGRRYECSECGHATETHRMTLR